MADPIRTDDFPTYDNYPGPESPGTPRAGRDSLPTTYRQDVRAEGAAGDDRLNQTAEQIGSTVGRAVQAVRELPERLQQARSSVRDRMTVIRGGGEDKAQQRVAELKDSAQRKYQDMRAAASRLASRARVRARQVADERPLYVVAGVAAAAFLVGSALRIWRNHE